MLPVHAVLLPSVLKGKQNGKLPASALVDTPGQEGGPTVRLVEPAARAWRALCAAALAAGHVLKATSAVDSFRPYDVQEKIFRQRYSTTRLAGRPTRTWQGKTWWQKPGTAAAAVPGTSNHGLGLAVDTGEESDDDTGTESIDRDTLAWLVANEERFGFSHELQSEPWHIRYFAGDRVPQAVLDYEAILQEEDMPPAPAIVEQPVFDATGKRVGSRRWVFVRGIDGALWASRDGGGFVAISGILTSGPSATVSPDGAITVAARGQKDGDGYATYTIERQPDPPGKPPLAVDAGWPPGWTNLGGNS